MHMKVWKMVPMLLDFTHPYSILPSHVQLLRPPFNHNIMMFDDCPQQNRSYPVTWDEDSPFFLTTLYYLWECNNKIIIYNIQDPSWMILVAPWSRLMGCIPKLFVPIIGHELTRIHIHFLYWHLESSNSECLHIGQLCYLQQRHMNPIHNYQWFAHKDTCLDLELMQLCEDMHLAPTPIIAIILVYIHLYMVRN